MNHATAQMNHKLARTAQQSAEDAHAHNTGTAHTNRPTHTGLTDPRPGSLSTHTSKLTLKNTDKG